MSKLKLSSKSKCVMQSEIRNMTLECTKVNGINLAQGVCDTPVPPEVMKGVEEGMREGFNIYTRYDGLPELRNALADKLRKQGLDANPDGEIIVSNGATGAFYCALMALLEPGDEVILFEPYCGYHLQTLRALDMGASFVTLKAPDWKFFPEDLGRAITPKTRGILVNTPANPSGKVFTREELDTIKAFAEKHDLFVFTDEIYEYFIYDGRKHISPATLPAMKQRTIAISGMSKTFSVTGWRIGYAIADAKWAQTIGYFNDLVYVCAPAPLQIGVARGLKALSPEYYQELCQEYAGKRDQICEALERGGMKPCVPQGAYYVLADISKLPGKNSKERALHLLHKTGVASVPGSAFYHRPEDGDGLTRFCFAKQKGDLDEACKRLAAFRA